MATLGRLQSGATPSGGTAAPANLPAPTLPSVGRLQSGKTTPDANVVPKTGFLSGLENAASGMTQSAWSGIKNAWSVFTYWESRPSQAIETTIAKAMGVPEASGLNPLKVLTGAQKSNLSGRDIVTQIENDAGKDTSSWQENAGATIGGMVLDVATDPFMYLSGDGLWSKVGEVYDEAGKSLGILSDDGIKALKDFTETSGDATRDLTKAAPATIEAGKSAIAAKVATGETGLVTERGLKFAGQTILSGERIDKLITAISDSKMADWIADSPANKVWQNTFNPRIVNGVDTGEWHNDYMNYLAKQSYVNDQAGKTAVGSFMTDGMRMSNDDKAVLNDVIGDTKATFGGLGSDALKNLTPEQLVKYAADNGKEISMNVANHALKFWNEDRPFLDGIARELGMTDEELQADHLRSVKAQGGEVKVYSQSRGLRKLIGKMGKGTLSDEDWVRGAMKATGQDQTAIDSAIYDLKHPLNLGDENALHEVAMKARVAYGMSQDPELRLATEYAEKISTKNKFDFIDSTLAKYGEKIDPADAGKYRSAGYTIITPKSLFTNLKSDDMYAVENKGIADSLNTMWTKTPDSEVAKGFRKASGRLVNLYFLNPLTSAYHFIHNVMMNIFLAGGMNGFDNLTKGFSDVRDESELYQVAKEAGTFKPKADFRSMDEIVAESFGKPEGGIVRKTWDLLNPFGNTNVGNRLFGWSDEGVRMGLFRNAIDSGAAPKEAAYFVNHTAGNWKDITPFEKQTFQLMYPYYSWFKTNMKLQFGTWLTNPQRQLLPIKVWNMLNEAAAGVPLWQNDTGAGWKIATGQRNAKGEMIYVTPAVSTNLVPELIQGGALGILNKVLSGPIPTAVSEAVTGKTPYQNLYGVSTPFADPGAPLSARFSNLFLSEVSPQGTDAIQQGKTKGVANTLIQTLSGWDTTHPMWQNIVETFLQSYTAPVEQTWIQNYYQSQSYKKYVTDLKKYQKKAAAQ